MNTEYKLNNNNNNNNKTQSSQNKGMSINNIDNHLIFTTVDLTPKKQRSYIEMDLETYLRFFIFNKIEWSGVYISDNLCFFQHFPFFQDTYKNIVAQGMDRRKTFVYLQDAFIKAIKKENKPDKVIFQEYYNCLRMLNIKANVCELFNSKGDITEKFIKILRFSIYKVGMEKKIERITSILATMIHPSLKNKKMNKETLKEELKETLSILRDDETFKENFKYIKKIDSLKRLK